MKIRIKGNSLRIRLSRTEVNTLATDGYIEETTQFPSGTFRYAMQTKNDLQHLAADFNNNTVTLLVPELFAKEWPGNETIGIDHKLAIPGGETLALLLEKDFKCIDADVSEDQSDNYEHPMISC